MRDGGLVFCEVVHRRRRLEFSSLLFRPYVVRHP